jgi:hypothetical protein
VEQKGKTQHDVPAGTKCRLGMRAESFLASRCQDGKAT